MGKKHKKAATAWAQANRHPAQATSPPPPVNNTNSEIELNFADKPGDLASNSLMVDLDNDCGYKGGVNIIHPDTEYVPGDTSTEFDLKAKAWISLVVMNLKGISRSRQNCPQRLHHSQS